MFSRIILTLFFLLSTFNHGYTTSIDKHRDRLSSITEDINRKKQILHKLSKEERITLNKLFSIEREIKIGERKLDKLQTQLSNVYKDVCDTQKSIHLTTIELKERQNILLNRLNAMYKYRGGDLLEILFSTDDLADMSKRLYFMTLVAKADIELINDIKEKKNAYIEKKRILQANYNKISEIKKAQEKFLFEQEKLKESREQLLTDIRTKKSLYQHQIAKLERESLEIKQLIRNLEAKKKKKHTQQFIAQGRGDLPWPVKNRKKYRTFGKYKHPKFDAYVMNKGIDIATNKGETVTSIKEGRVVFANLFKGYGLLVIIDHGNGLYSLYAHLGKIFVSVNDEVSKGTPIGRTGNQFDEEGYNLHFEIRINGEPVDPLDWLVRG